MAWACLESLPAPGNIRLTLNQVQLVLLLYIVNDSSPGLGAAPGLIYPSVKMQAVVLTPGDALALHENMRFGVPVLPSRQTILKHGAMAPTRSCKGFVFSLLQKQQYR